MLGVSNRSGSIRDISQIPQQAGPLGGYDKKKQSTQQRAYLHMAWIPRADVSNKFS